MNPQIGSINIELSARVKGSGPSVVMGTVQVPLMVKNMAANRLEIDINPMMEYVAESFKAVFASDTVLETKGEPLLDEAEEIACAWADYRKDYGIDEGHIAGIAHKAFKAGWKAAREGDQSGVQR